MYFFMCKSVERSACCPCHCLALFRQDHGFDPPCGSHQLLVFKRLSLSLSQFPIKNNLPKTLATEKLYPGKSKLKQILFDSK